MLHALEWSGVDVPATLRTAALGGADRIVRLTGGDAVVIRGGRGRVTPSLFIGESIRVGDGRLTVCGALSPDTVCLSLPGLPLSAVLEHPALPSWTVITGAANVAYGLSVSFEVKLRRFDLRTGVLN